MHSYTVEFRIWSEKEDVDLEAITKDIGINPTNTRIQGEAKSLNRVFTESMWGYEVYPGKNWASLEEALESLLKVLKPLKEKIWAYLLKYNVVIWCGHFTSSFDGGPKFSPELLEKLSELGVELYLDTYCCADEEQPTGA
jgi:hypothetical protein